MLENKTRTIDDDVNIGIKQLNVDADEHINFIIKSLKITCVTPFCLP